VAREIEDIEALLDAADGSAFLFGISSGAALAFEAALALGGKVKQLAMYEAPYNDDESARQAWKDFRKQLKDVLAAGRRGDAVALFMRLLGVPALILDGGASEWPFMHITAVALANAIPTAQHRTLEGQTHEVSPEALAPVLVEFFNHDQE
jgi:pimeloyl-ACP methyl ester carboxylesterase